MKEYNLIQFLKKTIFVLLYFCFITVFFSAEYSFAKDYFIQSVKIDAQLNPDGSMEIREKRTYMFSGHFHWATYFLPTKGIGGIVDFSVGEEGRPYLESNKGAEGTYQYEEGPDMIRVKWFFDAEDEHKTFVISFRILDVVKVYQDCAVLYYKFVGTGWEKPSSKVKVNINPPESVSKEEVRAWAHGPLWGKIEIFDNGVVKANVENLPAHTFWEVRAIYPVQLFSEVKTEIPEKTLPQILEAEKRWAEEANRTREEWIKKKEVEKARKRYGAWLVFGLSGIAFLICYNLYNRHGRKHKVHFPETFYSEIPSNIPPALLSCLLYQGQVSGGALVGTLLDLARRGFLKIREEMEMKKTIFGSFKKRRYWLEFDRDIYSKSKSELLDFEEDLLNFIFNDLSQGKDTIDFKTLKKRRGKFTPWFNKWQKKVKKLGESKGYWEKGSLKARNKGIVLSVILFVIAGACAYFIQEWAIVSAISGSIIMVISFFLPRRTPEFELEAKKWKALKKYLVKYHFRESNTRFLIEEIGKFLVYGVVLGLPSQVVKKMAELVPEGEQSRFIPWYVYTGAHADFSPSGFGEALSTLMTSASTTVSSSAGTGGGASGGGGGGAGGSGGGAG